MFSKGAQMAISSPGIGSNLDINSIVKQLMNVEAQPLTTLAKKEASFQAKLSAFGSISSALSTFQSALSGLSSPAKFQTLSATSSDSSVATATAASQAVAGSYNINVTALARAQTIASAGKSSTTAAIGAGGTTTLTFQFGTIGGNQTPVNGIYPAGATFTQDANQATGTVTIDSSNNSLQGIRDAINKAAIGVTATIISDGSTTPNRLVISSNKTGATSSMKITVSGDDDLEGFLAYDPGVPGAAGQKLTETTSAQNTALTVNGISITSATKTISDAIQGVTLSALKEGTSTLTVARDTASVTTAINGFVKAFNEANKTLKDLTAYNPATKSGGPLVGDATVRRIQFELRQVLNTSIPELTGNVKTLSDVGITFQKDGTLAVNSTKLQSAITNNFTDIAALFAPYATTTDSLVSYVSSSSATKAGKYSIDLTAVATQGAQIGTVDLNAGPTVIAADTTFNVTVDGSTATVPLTAGSYTAAQLATMVQSAINGASTFTAAGITVKATIGDNGYLNVTSNRYGASSAVLITGATGTTSQTLFGALPSRTTGVDVAGSIGSATATGSGQTLTGATGSDTEGLALLVTGGTATARGTVNFSRGYAERLNAALGSFLGASGIIANRSNGLSTSIKDIARSQEAVNRRLIDVEKRYRAQFNALDKAISGMSQTSAYLQQQLSNLPKIE